MAVVRRNESISTWEDGDFIQGFALLSRKDVRQDRKGREYVDAELTDSSGRMAAKIWPDSPAVNGRFAEKDFVAFKGSVRLYRDQLQLVIDHCRQARDADRGDGFDPDLLIPSSPEDLDDLERRLEALLPGALERPALQALASEAQRRYGAALRVHPAAKRIHHAYRGGLLEHVVKMAELAVDVCRHYPQIDRDLVLLGVYFHDLGKLREIGAMPANDYTIEGQLVGHIVIGVEMLRECCAALDEMPEDLRLHLEHLIVSHHGRREWGSPIEPSTPEAFVLHQIDNLDSKLNQLRDLHPGDGELQYVRALGRTIYLGRPEKADDDDG